MPFHFCMDEVRLILLALPVIPGVILGIKMFIWRVRPVPVEAPVQKTETCCDEASCQ